MGWVAPIKDKNTLNAFKKALMDNDVKYYIMFEIGIGTGMMLQDILKLKKKDVYNKDTIESVIGSRKIVTTYHVPEDFKVILNNYLKDMDDDDYIVSGRNNTPLSREQAYRVFKQVGSTVGLSPIGAQTMRKTFAWNYYESTGDITYLQTLLNHASPSITYRYIGEKPNIQLILRKASTEENQRSRYLLYLDDSGVKRIDAAIDQLVDIKKHFEDPRTNDSYYGCVDSFLAELETLLATFEQEKETIEQEQKRLGF
jgi:integrase